MMEGLVVCENCYYVGRTRIITKGSPVVEFLLWVFFIIPGIIYSMWMRITRFEVCPQCESQNIVPFNSPRGKKLFTENRAWAPYTVPALREYREYGFAADVSSDSILRGDLVVCENCYLFGTGSRTFTKGSTEYDGCPNCKSQNMVPLDSPRGRKLSTENKTWAKCGNCICEPQVMILTKP